MGRSHSWFGSCSLRYFHKIPISKAFFKKKGMENLKECVGPRQYSVVSQANFCYNGLPALYSLGFVGKFASFSLNITFDVSGTLVQAIAWFLLIFTGIQLKSVLEKMTADVNSYLNNGFLTFFLVIETIHDRHETGKLFLNYIIFFPFEWKSKITKN